MSNTLQTMLNNAIQSGVARGWVVQDCAITRQKERDIMSEKKVDFSKIDFGKLRFKNVSIATKGCCGVGLSVSFSDGVLYLGSSASCVDAIVATRTEDSPWVISYQYGLSVIDTETVAAACRTANEFIRRETTKTYEVVTPAGYEIADVEGKTTLIDTIHGMSNHELYLQIQLGNELLKQNGNAMVDENGVMSVDGFSLQCRGVTQ